METVERNHWYKLPISSDAALIGAAKRGDRQAFDRLMGRHEPALRRFICRLASPEEAKDLSQEVWLGAWVNLRNFDGRSRFVTWITQIAMYKVSDHYRSSAPRIGDSPIDGQEFAGSNPYPAQDVKMAVQQAVTHLTDDRRQLLDLYYAAGLTLQEISTLLDRKLSTVKYHFYEAHKDVETQLGSDWNLENGI